MVRLGPPLLIKWFPLEALKGQSLVWPKAKTNLLTTYTWNQQPATDLRLEDSSRAASCCQWEKPKMAHTASSGKLSA